MVFAAHFSCGALCPYVPVLQCLRAIAINS